MRLRIRSTCRSAVSLFLLGTVLASAPAPVSAAGQRTSAPVARLLGAGSTFDAPFFARAFAAYMTQNPVAIAYRAVGSGAGIQQFSKGLVDFGASDVPMSDAELRAAQAVDGSVVQVPVALGGVAIAYNLPGITAPLRLDGPTLALMYLGGITRWNDPLLGKLNPGLALPDLPIVPVHRSDSSGTTYIMTNYLSMVSTAWRESIGTGKVVSWPAGIEGNGNPGVAAAVTAHPGALGYVELDYVLTNHLAYASVENRFDNFVLPSANSLRAAAAQRPFITDTDFSIVDQVGARSYPIAGYSWVLLREHPRSQGAALVKLLHWLVTDGQQFSTAPLPYDIQQRAIQLLLAVQ